MQSNCEAVGELTNLSLLQTVEAECTVSFISVSQRICCETGFSVFSDYVIIMTIYAKQLEKCFKKETVNHMKHRFV